MRKAIGIIIIVIGIAAFIGSAGSLRPGFSANFMIGWFLPATLIITVGAIVLFWEKLNTKQAHKP